MADIKELAKRAVACKAWRWMPGMRYVAPYGYHYRVDHVAHAAGVKISDECLPDLTDPATIGWLMSQVREGYPRAWTMWVGDTWYLMTIVADEWTTVTTGETEAECLVSALEMEVGND